MTRKRKNLVVVRAGDSSLHPQWLSGDTPRNFDLFVSYFGDQPGRFQDTAEYYESAPGLKYPALARLMEQKRGLFLDYGACWLPDDDLSASLDTVCRMFDLFHAYHLWLAQPALSPGSHFSYPEVRQNPAMTLRFTGFVEIMCPIVHQCALDRLGPSFSLAVSGWGLDFLWPHLLNHPRDRIAILDETPVLHSRPIRGGSFYKACKNLGINPHDEMKKILSEHNLTWRKNIPVHGSVRRTASTDYAVKLPALSRGAHQ